MGKKNKILRKKEDIKNNPDNKIDEDFEGYPAGPAKEETIKPDTDRERKAAGLSSKKKNRSDEGTDEQQSDGSANAFDNK